MTVKLSHLHLRNCHTYGPRFCPVCVVFHWWNVELRGDNYIEGGARGPTSFQNPHRYHLEHLLPSGHTIVGLFRGGRLYLYKVVFRRFNSQHWEHFLHKAATHICKTIMFILPVLNLELIPVYRSLRALMLSCEAP